MKRYGFAHKKNTEVKYNLTFHWLLFSRLDSAAAAAEAWPGLSMTPSAVCHQQHSRITNSEQLTLQHVILVFCSQSNLNCLQSRWCPCLSVCLMWSPFSVCLCAWHPNVCYLLSSSPCISQACQGWSICPQANSLIHYPIFLTLSLPWSLFMQLSGTLSHFFLRLAFSLWGFFFPLSLSALIVFASYCLHTQRKAHAHTSSRLSRHLSVWWHPDDIGACLHTDADVRAFCSAAVFVPAFSVS